MLSPVHTYDAATPLEAELCRAKASKLVYSENWVISASFLGRIPGPASHAVTWEESLPAGGGGKREGDEMGGEGPSWEEESTGLLTRRASPPLPYEKMYVPAAWPT